MPDIPLPLESGTIVADRYVIAGAIGMGAFGIVYRCHDRVTEGERALKVVSTWTASQRRIRQRFLAEARVMANLSHPNLLPVFDVGEDGPMAWYVMELAPGGSMSTWLKDHPEVERAHTAAVAIAQILDGLAHAHENGVVHRDVKPSNVLVHDAQHFKLGDFGIARDTETPLELTHTGDSLGTRSYAAPEQRADARQAHEAADVYAAGATLFRLARGQVPGALPMLHFIELDAAAFPRVPAPLLDVVRRATRLLPESRYPSAAAMAEAVRAAAAAL